MKKKLALLRIEAEFKELVYSSNEKVCLLCENESFILVYTITLLDGYYKNHTYVFNINIPQNYPFSPPKPVCITKVLHPSIDDLGRVCLNITREDWSVQQTLQVVIFGISSIFYDVPTDNPFNQKAHSLLIKDPSDFIKEVNLVYNSNKI
ncbi:ubiquitin-conjugating enzyme E2 M [Nematocida sp. ERTm5]|nr:ubiquitin-conjugating enzyme E2 M [Nematocida sp. ERTm5]